MKDILGVMDFWEDAGRLEVEGRLEDEGRLEFMVAVETKMTNS